MRVFWPAALSLIGQRPQRVFSLFASRIQPKYAAAPLYQSRTWCTRSMDRLEALCKVIRTPGIECTASVRIGIPYEEILSEAEKIAPDLIVLGGKGYSALARILLGSTAEQVVRFARCSVLVARHPPDQLPPSPAQKT